MDTLSYRSRLSQQSVREIKSQQPLRSADASPKDFFVNIFLVAQHSLKSVICNIDAPIFAPSVLSDMNSQHRPPTMLLESPPDFGQVGKSSLAISPSVEPPDDPTFDSAKLSPEPLRLVSKKRSAVRKINEDPWRTYEPGMQIYLGREVILAQHRENNMELVDVQKLQQTPSPVEPMLQFMGQISHSSFPSLKECFVHDGCIFLVWEPLELSVSQLLAVKSPIAESELAAIVRPVSVKMLNDRSLRSNPTGS